MSKKSRSGQPHRQPIRKGEYGGRAADIAGVVVLAVFFLLAMLSVFRIRIPMPSLSLPTQLDSTAARIILAFVGLFLTVIIFAALWKWWEIRKAATWPSVAGRITRSRQCVRTTTHPEGGATVREIADIEFQYEVAGALYAGDRPTLAEVLTPQEIAAMLARYPVGTTVMVHYNPADPADSVLERDAPPGALKGCLLALALCIAGTLFLMRVATEGPEFVYPWLRQALPEANLPFMFFFLVVAIILVGASAAMARNVLKVRGWPATEGEVLSTAIRRHGGSDYRRRYRPIVRYRYAVGGVQRENDNIEHGMETSGAEAWALRVVARYPAGSKVAVRYNPIEPGQSSLDTSLGALGWIVVALTSAFVVATVVAAGLV
jgi:hypothetical protein